VKALSLWQPHAQAVALGLKTFETRHWSTAYRGPLAIHAAKRAWIDEDDWHAEARRRLRRRMEERGCFGMAYGAVVCVVDLRDCVRTTALRGRIDPDAEFWGDFSEGENGRGRYGFQLTRLLVLDEPVYVRGEQGLFEVSLAGFQARPSANLSLFGNEAEP
jgi:hypothetical protein